ncbi:MULTISPECIES: lipoyl(octanoyl) transferase LipB [Acidiphilium]|uniref:Octanoyltransferase n=1 Tax=Acidiphilium rubrum TaxID=526 RepID=A0A8G2FL99_ACIRU|nr:MULTISPECIES: lipoyl(octanoyl) transferase LipB [Acidiphilium]SIQ42758.1 lipoyl(octanoyl) transferase [Acidiphilium rubrum]
MDQPVSTTTPIEWKTEPGLLDYQAGLATMQARAAAIRAGTAREQIWLVEHPPLYTAGTSAQDTDLVAPGATPIFRTGRGGQWTYHGPGQRIAYVMLDLARPHGIVPARDIRQFVAGLEAWLIETLAVFGVHGETREGRVGIWVADPASGREAKIAAIGVRVSRWVSYHGIALNVAPDLAAYDGIIPCGISAHGVTSLAALGIAAPMPAVDAALRSGFARIFGDAPSPLPPPPPPPPSGEISQAGAAPVR